MKKVSEYCAQTMGDVVTVVTSNSMYGPNRQTFKKITPAQEIINGVTVKRFSFMRWHLPVLRFASKLLNRINRQLPQSLAVLRSGPVSGKMNREIDNIDADVIGASSIDYLFADYPIKREHRKNPKPFVMYGALHLHNNTIPLFFINRIKAADYYIANTGYEKKMIMQAGIEGDKIKVVGAGSDIYDKADFSITTGQLQTKYNIQENEIVITYIGRQETLKGIPVLIDAFLNTGNSFTNTRLFICGAAGGYTAELQNLAATNVNVQLFTNISDLEKTEILRITDILVLPSKEESFGVVFLEAWSFSKPVIGANIGAIASLINDGKDGLLFKVDDAASLAEKLSVLIQDKALREQMGVAGNKKFKDNYTWDIIAKKFRDVYQLAINKFKAQQSN